MLCQRVRLVCRQRLHHIPFRARGRPSTRESRVSYCFVGMYSESQSESARVEVTCRRCGASASGRGSDSVPATATLQVYSVESSTTRSCPGKVSPYAALPLDAPSLTLVCRLLVTVTVRRLIVIRHLVRETPVSLHPGHAQHSLRRLEPGRYRQDQPRRDPRSARRRLGRVVRVQPRRRRAGVPDKGPRQPGVGPGERDQGGRRKVHVHPRRRPERLREKGRECTSLSPACTRACTPRQRAGRSAHRS